MEKTSDKQSKTTSMAGKAGRKMSKLFKKLKTMPKRSIKSKTGASELKTAPSVTSIEDQPVVLQVPSHKLSQFLQKEESATLVMSERVEDPVCLQVDPDKLKRILAQ